MVKPEPNRPSRVPDTSSTVRSDTEVVAVTPRAPTPVECIENNLQNPWRSAFLSMRAQSYVSGVPGRALLAPSRFLSGLAPLLTNAQAQLDELCRELALRDAPLASLDARAEAADLLRRVQGWCLIESARAGSDPDYTLELPISVEKQLGRVSEIGARIAMVWRTVTLTAAGAQSNASTAVPDRVAQRPDTGANQSVADLPAVGTFRKQGDIWEVSYAGKTEHIPDIWGLHFIAELLAKPEQPFDTVELNRKLKGESLVPYSGDDALDASARTACKKQLAALEDEIAFAAGAEDDDRLTDLNKQKEKLISQWQSDTGSHGRSRRLGDRGDQTRKNVGNNIVAALKAIRRVHVELADHLDRAIPKKHGWEICYQRREKVTWILR